MVLLNCELDRAGRHVPALKPMRCRRAPARLLRDAFPQADRKLFGAGVVRSQDVAYDRLVVHGTLRLRLGASRSPQLCHSSKGARPAVGRVRFQSGLLQHLSS